MKAVICQTHDEFEKAGHGAIYLWRFSVKLEEGGTRGHIMMKCPGCGHESAMHVRVPGTPHPTIAESWEVSGLPDEITLHPSINAVGCCGWHGWLKNGVYSK
jgi:hypothetical protein